MDQFQSDSSNTSPSRTTPKDDKTPRNLDKAEWRNNNNRETIRQQSSSSLGKEMTDSCSHTSIDSQTLRTIDQAFAEYMRKDKSLQRVDSTPDPIPRFFTEGTKQPSSTMPFSPQLDESEEQATSLQIYTNEKDAKGNIQSPSPLNFEKRSKPISANDLANDDDNHDNRKGKVEIGQEKCYEISSPLSQERIYPDDQKSTSNEGHQRNEAAKSPNGSHSNLMSTKSLDNKPPLVSSNFCKSTSHDDQIVELNLPQLSRTSSVRTAPSDVSNEGNVTYEYLVDKNECIIPRTTKQDTSQASLHQIESFHHQFVGNLSLLSGTSDNDVEADVADEKKTFTDPVVGGCGFIGNDSVNDGKVGEQIKNCGKKPLEKDEGISRDQKPPSRGEISPKVKVFPGGAAAGSNIAADNNRCADTHGECSNRQQQRPSSPIPVACSSCPVERITDFVNKYIDSLEGEWQIRRSVWLENNKHNPNSKRKKNSVYAYKTFREYMTNTGKLQQIDLQVPFDLPEVEENNGNPILQDEILPTQESSSKKLPSKLKKQRKASQIPKSNVVGSFVGSRSARPNANQKVNSTAKKGRKPPVKNDTSAVKTEDNPCITPESSEFEPTKVHANDEGAAALTDAEEEDQTTKPPPMDLSPFIDQCGGILDELKTIIQSNKMPTKEQQRKNKRVDEIVGVFVKKYIDFLEGEWKRRRDIWIEQNMMHENENSVYQSFKTFGEGFANQEIEPQVPFDLPEINAIKKNITEESSKNAPKDSTSLENNAHFENVSESKDSLKANEYQVSNDSVASNNVKWWDFILEDPKPVIENPEEKSSIVSGEEIVVDEDASQMNRLQENAKGNINSAMTEDVLNNPEVSKDKDDETIVSENASLGHHKNADSTSDVIKTNQQISLLEQENASTDLVPTNALSEPVFEIYEGLSREDTSSNLEETQNKPQPAEMVEYQAFVNGRMVNCKSLEHKTRLDVCSLKLSTVQKYASNLKDMTTLPGVKILRYLSLADFKNCRLVSKSWNTAVITSKYFLSRTIFIVEKKPLGALATLEASRVRWQHLRCSIIPSMNFTSTSYNGRFLSSNLRVAPMSSRNEPVTHTLSTIVFQNIDIHRQQFVQWIQNCKRLNSIEIRNCNFLKTTISMNMDKTNRVMERVQVLRFADMDIVKLAEALRFFLPATRRLHTLEIIQRRDVKGTAKSVSLSTRKGAEDELASVLCPTLKRNASTLRNIYFELSSSKNYLLQTRIMEVFQETTFRLCNFALRSYSPLNPQPCFKMDSYASTSKNLVAALKSTLISSREMTLLDFPMLSIDFINGEEGSHLLSPKLEKLGVQLEMPVQETKLNLGARFLHLSQLDLYGSPLENAQWFHIREAMPQLTQLVVFSGGLRDKQIQAIIRNLKLLQVLRLENVQDVTDFGITGMEPAWIERLKMYWPEKIDGFIANNDQFPRDKIRFVGKSLSSLGDLRTFIMKGSFGISNVGILYGFHSRELTTLELHGSAVNASNSGLFILGFQCPKLLRVKMALRHTKVNQSGVRDFYDQLENRAAGSYHIDVLPCLELELANDDETIGQPMLSSF